MRRAANDSRVPPPPTPESIQRIVGTGVLRTFPRNGSDTGPDLSFRIFESGPFFLCAPDLGRHRALPHARRDRKSTRLNSSHVKISYAVFCLKKKKLR